MANRDKEAATMDPAPAIEVVDQQHPTHRRARSGTACCGAPSKQDHLTDGMDFDCPSCWRAYTIRVRG